MTGKEKIKIAICRGATCSAFKKGWRKERFTTALT